MWLVLEDLMKTIDVHRNALITATIAASLLAATFARAEDGVTDDTIVFGQAAVFEGPAAALGLGMRAGIQAAFEEANKQGGIHGRKLKLVALDDGWRRCSAWTVGRAPSATRWTPMRDGSRAARACMDGTARSVSTSPSSACRAGAGTSMGPSNLR